jgi:hypothetical protein
MGSGASRNTNTIQVSTGIKPNKDGNLPIKLLDIHDKLQTGDIILNNGTDWASYGIKAITFSQWTHIALVIRNPSKELKRRFNLTSEDDFEEVFVFDTDYDSIDKRLDGGVQFNSLREWGRQYVRLYGDKLKLGKVRCSR